MAEHVNHPAHYNTGGIEVIDAIEAWGFGEGFNRGDAIKYIARAGRKNPETEIEDLEKARWYIEREIQRLSKDRVRELSGTTSIEDIHTIAEALHTWAVSARFGDGTMCICNAEYVKKAAELVGALTQVRWERHVAIEQLHSIGKELGEKMDDVQALLGRFDGECESCKVSIEE